MKILFVAGEGAPFIKTGGLGDVIGSLSKNLAEKGEDVRVILPKYNAISEELKKQFAHLRYIFVNVGWRRQYCGIETMKYNNVTYYFIDNEYYFKRGSLYGFYDEAERFAFFDRAVLEVLEALDWYPDVIHCNDWQCGMIPVLLKLEYKYRERFYNIKTVFSIHNMAFQGNYDPNILTELFGYDMEQYNNGALEFYGAVSFMKGALMYSDKILTVSETYANEIKTPEYGEKMDSILRYKGFDLSGIVNGIDYDEFNPENDKLIYKNYSLKTIKNKAINKKRLQEDLGLNIDAKVPMIAMVTRLTDQKGIRLLLDKAYELLNKNVQLVVLGTGNIDLENSLKNLEYQFNGKVSINLLFDNNLAHKIYAGADMFLMPSAFEPCGLGQLIALRYGTIPIVRETGGLRDTVEAFNKFDLTGNGFSFYNYSSKELIDCITEAIYIYDKTDKWDILIKNAMESDNSWEKSSARYLEVYKNLIN